MQVTGSQLTAIYNRHDTIIMWSDSGASIDMEQIFHVEDRI
jgi:hypothetical protein